MVPPGVEEDRRVVLPLSARARAHARDIVRSGGPRILSASIAAVAALSPTLRAAIAEALQRASSSNGATRQRRASEFVLDGNLVPSSASGGVCVCIEAAMCMSVHDQRQQRASRAVQAARCGSRHKRHTKESGEHSRLERLCLCAWRSAPKRARGAKAWKPCRDFSPTLGRFRAEFGRGGSTSGRRRPMLG